MNPTTPAVLLTAPCSEVKLAPAPRLRGADRQQLDPQPRWLDDLIEAEHRTRVVWAFVEELDLTVRYDRVRAVAGQAGRRVTDAWMLMALWL
jgi:hypothetical protein